MLRKLALSWPHRGQTKPSGHLNLTKCFQQESSLENLFWNWKKSMFSYFWLIGISSAKHIKTKPNYNSFAELSAWAYLEIRISKCGFSAPCPMPYARNLFSWKSHCGPEDLICHIHNEPLTTVYQGLKDPAGGPVLHGHPHPLVLVRISNERSAFL